MFKEKKRLSERWFVFQELKLVTGIGAGKQMKNRDNIIYFLHGNPLLVLLLLFTASQYFINILVFSVIGLKIFSIQKKIYAVIRITLFVIKLLNIFHGQYLFR